METRAPFVIVGAFVVAAIAAAIAAKRGATLVTPYDDALIIAGQGTAGREIVEDLSALGLSPDIVVVTASGGGLRASHKRSRRARHPSAVSMVILRLLRACGLLYK